MFTVLINMQSQGKRKDHTATMLVKQQLCSSYTNDKKGNI